MNTKLLIYTDGSHFKGKDFIGMGAVCLYNGVYYEYSNVATQESFSKFYKCSDEVSNPTAEMAAVAGVLQTISKSILVPIDIEIIADYTGVKEWNEFRWKASKPYIVGLRDAIAKFTSHIEAAGGSVTYRHIKGHQKVKTFDSVMNDKSDLLAKSVDIINSFNSLILAINAEVLCNTQKSKQSLESCSN